MWILMVIYTSINTTFVKKPTTLVQYNTKLKEDCNYTRSKESCPITRDKNVQWINGFEKITHDPYVDMI